MRIDKYIVQYRYLERAERYQIRGLGHGKVYFASIECDNVTLILSRSLFPCAEWSYTLRESSVGPKVRLTT